MALLLVLQYVSTSHIPYSTDLKLACLFHFRIHTQHIQSNFPLLCQELFIPTKSVLQISLREVKGEGKVLNNYLMRIWCFLKSLFLALKYIFLPAIIVCCKKHSNHKKSLSCLQKTVFSLKKEAEAKGGQLRFSKLDLTNQHFVNSPLWFFLSMSPMTHPGDIRSLKVKSDSNVMLHHLQAHTGLSSQSACRGQNSFDKKKKS